MEKPISAGDLVVAIRGCPRCLFRLGMVFKVLRISKSFGVGSICSNCHEYGVHPVDIVADHGSGALPVSWLKRIQPLDELEGVRAEETLKETA